MTTNRLSFHYLTFTPERDEIMVGRPDTDTYAVFPADGAALLQRLRSGVAPGEAAAWYEATYGSQVDMAEFIGTLRGFGFIRGPHEPEQAPVATSAVPRGHRVARLLFSRPAGVCFVMIGVLCLVALARKPDLRPSPEAVFFSDLLTFVQITFVIGQFPGILWHESLHVLAGIRFGLHGRLNVSRRLYFIVFETTVNGLLGLPRRHRYLVFMAGSVGDVALFSVLTLAATAMRDATGALNLGGRFFLALAYVTLLRLAWQFLLFLRTDLYYVFATFLGCTNLHAVTRSYVRNSYYRLTGRRQLAVDQSTWSPRDLAVARWYAPFAMAGVAFLVGVLIVGVVPLSFQFATQIAAGLSGGYLTPRSGTPPSSSS